MTKNPSESRDSAAPLTGWSIPAEDGVHRRTLVKGVAWTLPAVAVATATPAAAASGTPTLRFTQNSYTGQGCSTITGVQVRRTTDGTTPDPGKTITVTLTDGYTFSDGSTSHSATTDSNGLITLPAISVPAKGGTSTFAAASDSLGTTAPVSATAAPGGGNYQWRSTGQLETYSNIPSGAKAVGYGFFLVNGELWWKGRTTPVITGVTSAVGQHVDSLNADVATVEANGTSYQWNSNGQLNTYPNIPANATAVGYGFFLVNGELWWKGRTTPVITGVTSAVGQHVDSLNADVATFEANGKSYQWNSNGRFDTYDQIPANATAVGYGFFLVNGELWWKIRTTPVASNVSSAVGEHVDSTNADIATYVVDPTCS
ncbi:MULTISPECIES: hypothetical protein [unclassified Rathayibacter]|uniref:hypothetical protein n=1 Tax=unclassified Rathayibacter TaxID=2609250 RepID=UPI00188C7360|nr:MULTISPECIES: hypothetical protein [unclassified Rathayibacter]MBF4461350.1 hypothetical protein [Rathayibacter sp. VKM Ac-2879]MBF4502761.1 hypothetical protein [Rathayibacter sp. VKM Ac-2878]